MVISLISVGAEWLEKETFRGSTDALQLEPLVLSSPLLVGIVLFSPMHSNTCPAPREGEIPSLGLLCQSDTVFAAASCTNGELFK